MKVILVHFFVCVFPIGEWGQSVVRSGVSGGAVFKNGEAGLHGADVAAENHG